MKRCLNCMQEVDDERICPRCGYSEDIDYAEVYQLKPGTVLRGRYTVGTVLGFGGFGVVYKAWDEDLCRVVAIKEYFPTIYLTRNRDSDNVIIFDKKNTEVFEKGKTEFLDEARNVAKFNKDGNIVHVYDFFEANGTAYFVMEYLDGFTLKSYIAKATSSGKVFSCESALYVTRKVLAALGRAHSAGIIHRDVKPANIYILPDGEVKLFDFGAARFSDGNEEKTRTVIITPGYAAPEQYQLRSKQGAYTDVYAVGAMLYEMLTGVKIEESVNRKACDEVKNPSELNGSIPQSLSNAIMRAIAIQSEVRFKDTKEFLDALEYKSNVRDDRGEIRHKQRVRNSVIACVVVVVLITAVYVGLRYLKNYRNAVLTNTELTIAVLSDDAGEEEIGDMYMSMLSEFETAYPQVNVKVEIIGNEIVADGLDSLAEGEAFPDILIYDDDHVIPDEYLGSIECLYDEKSYDADQYLFLEDYREAFESGKRIPLSFEVPIVYENKLNEGLDDSENYNSYLDGETNYIGSSSDYPIIQRSMTGTYTIREEIYGGRLCRFMTWISLAAGLSEEKQAAASRVLMTFLSDNSQEIMTIEHDMGFPVNKNIWDVYIDINDEFSFLNGMTNDMRFDQEEIRQP